MNAALYCFLSTEQDQINQSGYRHQSPQFLRNNNSLYKDVESSASETESHSSVDVAEHLGSCTSSSLWTLGVFQPSSYLLCSNVNLCWDSHTCSTLQQQQDTTTLSPGMEILCGVYYETKVGATFCLSKPVCCRRRRHKGKVHRLKCQPIRHTKTTTETCLWENFYNM